MGGSGYINEAGFLLKWKHAGGPIETSSRSPKKVWWWNPCHPILTLKGNFKSSDSILFQGSHSSILVESPDPSIISSLSCYTSLLWVISSRSRFTSCGSKMVAISPKLVLLMAPCSAFFHVAATQVRPQGETQESLTDIVRYSQGSPSVAQSGGGSASVGRVPADRNE